MRSSRTGWAVALVLATALATLGTALAQNPPPKAKAATTKAARGKAGALPKKVAPNAADPLENAALDPLDKAAPAGARPLSSQGPVRRRPDPGDDLFPGLSRPARNVGAPSS